MKFVRILPLFLAMSYCHMAKGLLPNQGCETCESESFFKVSLSCWLSFALGSVRWESEFFFSFGIIIWIKFCYQKGFD